jgi:hypothetical protein
MGYFYSILLAELSSLVRKGIAEFENRFVFASTSRKYWDPLRVLALFGNHEVNFSFLTHFWANVKQIPFRLPSNVSSSMSSRRSSYGLKKEPLIMRIAFRCTLSISCLFAVERAPDHTGAPYSSTERQKSL